MERFGAAASEKLGWYVYALGDPRVDADDLGRWFYIGKGQNNRCFDHARGALAEDLHDPSLKQQKIKEISNSGRTPDIRIVAHGLSEGKALDLEAILIQVLPFLLNAIGGRGGADNWLAVQEIASRYDQPIRRAEITERILFVSLNGGKSEPSYDKIKEDPVELRRRTLGDWVTSRSEEVTLILGVYKSLVRCAFRVDAASIVLVPPTKKNGRRRYRWSSGEIESRWDSMLKNKRVIDDSGKVLTTFGPRQACHFSATAP